MELAWSWRVVGMGVAWCGAGMRLAWGGHEVDVGLLWDWRGAVLGFACGCHGDWRPIGNVGCGGAELPHENHF